MKLTREKIQRMANNRPSTPGASGGSDNTPQVTTAEWIDINNVIQNGNEFNFFDNANPSQNQAVYINYKAHNGENTGEAITDIYICNGQGEQTGVTLHVENVEVTDIIINGVSLAQKLGEIALALTDLDDRVTALENQ